MSQHPTPIDSTAHAIFGAACLIGFGSLAMVGYCLAKLGAY